MLRKIEKVMTGEGRSRFFSLGALFFWVSLLYGGIVKVRETLYKKGLLKSERLPCLVISVGNLTVGGTGKTPMTIHVARLVERLGYKVAVISRGYKGAAEKTGGIVSDGRTILIGPEAAGDEPFMVAKKLRNIPVVVGKNRVKVGRLAVKKFNPDVLVLDDAFQHLKLVRDINLVLLDSKSPFGNSFLLPRGTLREPISALCRGDAFVLTRSGSVSDDGMETSLDLLKSFTRGRSVFKSLHVPYICKVVKGESASSQSAQQQAVTYNPQILKGRRVFAFSGLAGNNDFRSTVEGFRCVLTGFSGFPDHHRYSDKDLDIVLQLSQESNADFIITSEKDYSRISHRIAWPIDMVVIGVKISFADDEDIFNAFIKKRLAESIPPRREQQ